jgi:hypothetical protein
MIWNVVCTRLTLVSYKPTCIAQEKLFLWAHSDSDRQPFSGGMSGLQSQFQAILLPVDMLPGPSDLHQCDQSAAGI